MVVDCIETTTTPTTTSMPSDTSQTDSAAPTDNGTGTRIPGGSDSSDSFSGPGPGLINKSIEFNPVGLVIGGSVGSVVIVVLLLGVTVWWRRRQRRSTIAGRNEVMSNVIKSGRPESLLYRDGPSVRSREAQKTLFSRVDRTGAANATPEADGRFGRRWSGPDLRPIKGPNWSVPMSVGIQMHGDETVLPNVTPSSPESSINTPEAWLGYEEPRRRTSLQ